MMLGLETYRDRIRPNFEMYSQEYEKDPLVTYKIQFVKSSDLVVRTSSLMKQNRTGNI